MFLKNHNVFKGSLSIKKMEDENSEDIYEHRSHHEEKKEWNNMRVDNNPDKKNPWMIASFILGIAVIVLLVMVFKVGITGNVVSETDASDTLIDYLNSKTGGGVEFVSAQDIGNLYEVTVNYQGQDLPVYITKDGDYFVQGAVPLTGNAAANSDTETETPTEVQKSDKPVVEAFIFSYCPYGLQFEKALFPVYDLLKDKADIKIVAIGAMHGEYEKQETLRQISIEELYNRDKLFAYLKEFDTNTNIGSCRGEDTCLNKYLPDIYKKLGIDQKKVEAYMASDAEAIYDEQNARANSLRISGSPTFVINGAEVQVSRNADTIKKAVCDAFNTAPSECSQTLSTTGPSAGFGASSSSSASTGVQCAT